MDFSVYISKRVKVDISSGYYYSGKVTEVDDKFLSMLDKNSKTVTIAISDILNVRELD